ncbi:hypothetical protein BN996_03444 [Haloferax massiliensis]|uniref:Uncharacterized protein n=1 Tax=Haloferax massiliensis TaxID=1476858 RepID=A0A0D6JWK2_9EURY|nr:hypothetical protein BN996_03444 [Haloferax massiliensis]
MPNKIVLLNINILNYDSESNFVMLDTHTIISENILQILEFVTLAG